MVILKNYKDFNLRPGILIINGADPYKIAAKYEGYCKDQLLLLGYNSGNISCGEILNVFSYFGSNLTFNFYHHSNHNYMVSYFFQNLISKFICSVVPYLDSFNANLNFNENVDLFTDPKIGCSTYNGLLYEAFFNNHSVINGEMLHDAFIDKSKIKTHYYKSKIPIMDQLMAYYIKERMISAGNKKL